MTLQTTAAQTALWYVVLLGVSAALICPDGGMCEDRNTCCKNMEGGYSCCPLPRAECCSDHLHCCYEGTLCDLIHEKCVNKTVSLPWMRRLPVKQLIDRVDAVICPDQESECPDGTTCCQIPDGSWGCCPFNKAVCCEDKRHCCPEGTKCDLVHSQCVPASLKPLPLKPLPLQQKLPATQRRHRPAVSSGSVTCPGGKSSCPDGFSCCQLTSGDYGCCPYPQAVCCSDHRHCCPSNTVCDLEHGVCHSGDIELPLLKKLLAASNDVECPDKKTSCPDQTTCCLMTDASYGCCPMPNAVCCSDRIHCCPAGTQCDLEHSTCTSTQAAAATQTEVTQSRDEDDDEDDVSGAAVPCNESVSCADGHTCCKSPIGEWACCPLPEAVCCDDHLHCCPHGTICNLAAETCDDPSGAMTPWRRKVPAFSSQTANSKCDRSTSCPGKSTCCRTPSGDWACCPLPQAVCCDDHVHCCPHGTVCNLEAETCDDPTGSTPLMKKGPALTTEAQDEKCDHETTCPGGTTCCKKTPGHWACCPLPQAVCCSDHQHCCPKGYECNVAEQTCDKPGGLRLRWLQKVAPQRNPRPPCTAAAAGQNMCDVQTSCPKDTTCCFMEQTQRWGCCPLPQAVCCSDGTHCCPRGHSCDPRRSLCSRGPDVIPWFTKLSATTALTAVTDVKCDNKSSCASGTTCCKLPSGEWGCCPLVKVRTQPLQHLSSDGLSDETFPVVFRLFAATTTSTAVLRATAATWRRGRVRRRAALLSAPSHWSMWFGPSRATPTTSYHVMPGASFAAPNRKRAARCRRQSGRAARRPGPCAAQTPGAAVLRDTAAKQRPEAAAVRRRGTDGDTLSLEDFNRPQTSDPFPVCQC